MPLTQSLSYDEGTGHAFASMFAGAAGANTGGKKGAMKGSAVRKGGSTKRVIPHKSIKTKHVSSNENSPARAAQSVGKSIGKPPAMYTQLKPKIRFKPGTKALREIRKYQAGISRDRGFAYRPLTTFKGCKRIFSDIARDVSALGQDKRLQNGAVHALREAFEMYMVELFQESQLEAFHAGRQTVYPNDMRLTRRIRGEITKAPPFPKMR